MKNLFIIGNWKSNETTHESKEWISAFPISHLQSPHKSIILCPPFSLLSEMKQLIEEKKLPIFLGSQDFSAFESGAHTGEESPALLKEFVSYTIVGHSERRKELGETDTLIAQKVSMAKEFGIQAILCVQGKETPIPEGVTLVAYEPIFAIGSGHPDTPENAESVIQAIKETNPQVKYVLYGGSVTPENVSTFTQMPSIDGVLVGGASLDPEKFAQIIEHA